MEIVKTTEGKINKKDFNKVVDVLRSGKVIAMPTDTIYGLSCVASKANAIRKIHKIKETSLEKSLIILISNLAMLHKIAFVDDLQEAYLKKIWFAKKNTPTTLILRRKKSKLGAACAHGEKIAVRLPKNELNYKIIEGLGEPLVSTSLNRSGNLPLKKLKDIEKEFSLLPDLIVDSGSTKRKRASRLIDISDINNIKILRK